MTHTHQKRTRSLTGRFLVLLCMCIVSLSAVSCISLPGEKEMEDRNLAAEYYDIALKYIEFKQYDKALPCLEKAREKAAAADYAKIDYEMARAYALSNKWDKAISLYETLLAQDPGNTNLKEAYAYSLYKGGDKEKALQLYAELCNDNPSDERIAKNYEALLPVEEPEDEPVADEPAPENISQDTDQEAIGS